jgi:diaminopimelate decarboxylase
VLQPNPLASARLTTDPLDLDPAVWPSGTVRAADGAIRIGGADARALAAEFGTPLHVVDETALKVRAEQARAAVEGAAAAAGVHAHVYYAGKAFLTAHVVRWMLDAGLRIDVCTGGELALALAAGATGPSLGFHGNNKSEAEIAAAVDAGVGALVLDSAQEVALVASAAARAGRVQRVRLRVNSGVHASTHEYLATAREDQKFGVALQDVPAIVAAVRAAPSLEFLGLHSHIGSQIVGTAGFAEAARRLLALHRDLLAGGPVPELNLGGGWGIAYTSGQTPADVEAVAADLVGAVVAAATEYGIPVPDLAVEPGRWIVGPAGVTLYTVGTVKDVEVQAPDGGSAVRRYVSVDGGMSDNIRAALYGADYTVRLASRASEAPQELVRVVGKHCESGDIVVREDLLPADVGFGDLVAVPATGAYHHSLASNYNLLTRPAVVAVGAEGAHVLVRRETIDDLLARDAGLTRVGSAA